MGKTKKVRLLERKLGAELSDPSQSLSVPLSLSLSLSLNHVRDLNRLNFVERSRRQRERDPGRRWRKKRS